MKVQKQENAKILNKYSDINYTIHFEKYNLTQDK